MFLAAYIELVNNLELQTGIKLTYDDNSVLYIEVIYASVRTGKENSKAVMNEPLPSISSELVDWAMRSRT